MVPVDSFRVPTRLSACRGALALVAFLGLLASPAAAATPCDGATLPGQCGWFDAGTLPPFVRDAIAAKNGTLGAGNVLVLTSGDPSDADEEISNDRSQPGCGTNPDGWQTYDCVQLAHFVPPTDSVVLALSSEWFEWYQTIFTDWMTISGAGVATVDVSINSWIGNKVDILPYGPNETGVVLLTSLAADKMIDIRVADSGDHIYDTAIVVVPASWFASVESSNGDPSLLCGNGELEPGEDCDDGNHITDDGCSSLCLGAQPPAPPPTPGTEKSCGNLNYVWPTGLTLPYACGADLCQGFRCVLGNTISPACYTASQCADACAGDCVDVQTAQLDCSTMCTVQPPANDPAPPPPPATCDSLVYVWPDGTTMPYACDDSCEGQRCVTGTTVSPECFAAGECDASTCPDGTCVDTPAQDCGTLCSLGEVGDTCTLAEKDSTRVAANQQGACFGNFEQCSGAGVWEIADGSWEPSAEACNGIDDDCNGVVDDMFDTCGDPGLCQNTVNTCDPNDPSVPIVCQPLPPPSPVEICEDGLDNDCDGSADDGCSCGDDECMPGETYLSCAADCPAPADGSPCDDGDLCTDGDSWQGGVCIGGAPVVCDSGSACIVDSACDPSFGCSGTKVDCGDTVACTVDSCDAVGGCTNLPDDALCDDADPCTTDSCDAVLGCAHTDDPTCGGQDADADGHLALANGGDDCDDANPDVHPGALETCNQRDDDCNGTTDDGFAVGGACESAANACGTTDAGAYVCTGDGTGVVCDAVAPADPAGLGDPCTSAANSCGESASGSIQCDGSCSAVVPADPAGLGDACTSSANSCGETTSGTIQCDGSCSAVVPTATDGDGDGSPDCLDGCAADAAKTAPGACGCGVADVDSNNNGTADCNETERADVTARIELRSKLPIAGRRLRYRIEVGNLGPNAVTSATVQIAITGGSFSDLHLPRTCSGTPAAITCQVPAIRGGRHRHLNLSLVPAAATTIQVSATAASPWVDPDPSNQTATIATVVP